MQTFQGNIPSPSSGLKWWDLYRVGGREGWGSGPFRDELWEGDGAGPIGSPCWLAHSLSLHFHQPYINPSTSHHHHFSPEDGNSMFLWNVGIYWRVYTVPQPRRTSSSSSSSLPWRPQISQLGLASKIQFAAICLPCLSAAIMMLSTGDPTTTHSAIYLEKGWLDFHAILNGGYAIRGCCRLIPHNFLQLVIPTGWLLKLWRGSMILL
jgi:hypothetical protein